MRTPALDRRSSDLTGACSQEEAISYQLLARLEKNQFRLNLDPGSHGGFQLGEHIVPSLT